MQILAQNPQSHVTPTNDLVVLVRTIREKWMNLENFQAQGLEKVRPRVEAGLRGLMTNFYQAELMSGRLVFDKSRGWPAHAEVLDIIFEMPIKHICCLRDVRAVLASMEKKHRESVMTRHAPFHATTQGRAKDYLHEKSVVGASINVVRDVLNRGLRDHLIIVPYFQLCGRPADMMAHIHAELGIPPFEYDFDNVEQATQEDDSLRGMQLHQIRTGPVLPAEPEPWKNYYQPGFTDRLFEQYGDITRLMMSGALPPASAPVERQPQGGDNKVAEE